MKISISPSGFISVKGVFYEGMCHVWKHPNGTLFLEVVSLPHPVKTAEQVKKEGQERKKFIASMLEIFPLPERSPVEKVAEQAPRGYLPDLVLWKLAEIAVARGDTFQEVLLGAVMCALSQAKFQFGVDVDFDKLCFDLELAESEAAHAD